MRLPFLLFHVCALTITNCPFRLSTNLLQTGKLQSSENRSEKCERLCYYFHVCSERKQNTESDWHKTTMKPCQWVVVHWLTNLMCFSVLFWMRVYVKSSPVFLALFSAVCVMLLNFVNCASSIRSKELYVNYLGLTFFYWLWHMEELSKGSRFNRVEGRWYFHSLSHFIAVGIILWNFLHSLMP